MRLGALTVCVTTWIFRQGHIPIYRVSLSESALSVIENLEIKTYGKEMRLFYKAFYKHSS